MVEGFEMMIPDEYLIHRYKYYSKHPKAEHMSFEDHLKSIDRLIEKHDAAAAKKRKAAEMEEDEEGEEVDSPGTLLGSARRAAKYPEDPNNDFYREDCGSDLDGPTASRGPARKRARKFNFEHNNNDRVDDSDFEELERPPTSFFSRGGRGSNISRPKHHVSAGAGTSTVGAPHRAPFSQGSRPSLVKSNNRQVRRSGPNHNMSRLKPRSAPSLFPFDEEQAPIGTAAANGYHWAGYLPPKRGARSPSYQPDKSFDEPDQGPHSPTYDPPSSIDDAGYGPGSPTYQPANVIGEADNSLGSPSYDPQSPVDDAYYGPTTPSYAPTSPATPVSPAYHLGAPSSPSYAPFSPIHGADHRPIWPSYSPDHGLTPHLETEPDLFQFPAAPSSRHPQTDLKREVIFQDDSECKIIDHPSQEDKARFTIKNRGRSTTRKYKQPDCLCARCGPY